jgi:hypothetical protein
MITAQHTPVIQRSFDSRINVHDGIPKDSELLSLQNGFAKQSAIIAGVGQYDIFNAPWFTLSITKSIEY